jgi:hypothetical protein
VSKVLREAREWLSGSLDWREARGVEPEFSGLANSPAGPKSKAGRLSALFFRRSARYLLTREETSVRQASCSAVEGVTSLTREESSGSAECILALVSIVKFGMRGDEARGPRGNKIPAATEGTEQVQGVPQSGQSMANCENYQSSEGFSEPLNFVTGACAC